MKKYSDKYLTNKIIELYKKDNNFVRKLMMKQGTRKQVIQSWIKGESIPSLRYIVDIANIYGLSMDFFVENL